MCTRVRLSKRVASCWTDPTVQEQRQHAILPVGLSLFQKGDPTWKKEHWKHVFVSPPNQESKALKTVLCLQTGDSRIWAVVLFFSHRDIPKKRDQRTQHMGCVRAFFVGSSRETRRKWARPEKAFGSQLEHANELGWANFPGVFVVPTRDMIGVSSRMSME
jgi:hypothetical protein